MLLTTSGCSSVMSHTGADQGYYAGTRANVEMMKKDDTSWAMIPLLAIDLPLSAAMDTLLLPYDYLRSWLGSWIRFFPLDQRQKRGIGS